MAIDTSNIDDTEDIEIGGKGLSFQDIVMIQLRKVTNLANVEFRGGFYTSVPTRDGMEKEIYVQDSREVFGNALYILALLTEPKFDKKMKEKFKLYEEKMEDIEEEFINKSSVQEEVILGELFYESTEDKILLETYRNKKLTLNLKLFKHLSRFLERKAYFHFGGGTYS